MHDSLTARLVIRSTASQWRVLLRVTDDHGQTIGTTQLATFARMRPVAMYGMYAAVTALQKLLGDRVNDGLTIETNKDGLSELRAVGLMPETQGI